ncbi:MAG: FG-GAP-like repeat-containing protein [bacterium]
MNRLYIIILVIAVIISNTVTSQTSFIKRTIDGERVTGINTGDLDNDGDLDIVVCNRLKNRIVFWRNDGGTPVQFTKVNIDSVFNAPMYNYIKDVNNDGRLDVIASSSANGVVAVWLNNGGTPIGWTKQIIAEGFSNAHSVYADDINGDGFIDIISSCGTSLNQVAWWKNSGSEPIVWSKNVVATNFRGSQTIMTSDINGDNRPDIVAAASDDDEIAWWRNEGGDTVRWTKFVVTKDIDLPHWIYACDIDLDNDIDILGAGYLSTEISLWKNEGGDTIKWTKQFIASYFGCPLTVHAADFDNDSKLDVIATGYVDDVIGYWKNNGGNPIKWTYASIVNGYNGPWPLSACDLDNDGDNDIIAGADILNSPGTAAPLTWWENKFILNDVDDKDNIKLNYNLKQNYPNPFNPLTQIDYSIPKKEYVNLDIYNSIGKKILSVINKLQEVGNYSVVVDMNSFCSGVYFCRLQAGTFCQTRKLILLK